MIHLPILVAKMSLELGLCELSQFTHVLYSQLLDDIGPQLSSETTADDKQDTELEEHIINYSLATNKIFCFMQLSRRFRGKRALISPTDS